MPLQSSRSSLVYLQSPSEISPLMASMSSVKTCPSLSTPQTRSAVTPRGIEPTSFAALSRAGAKSRALPPLAQAQVATFEVPPTVSAQRRRSTLNATQPTFDHRQPARPDALMRP